ncbi:hypothetical protein [Streptomyces sp. AK010]|uniref:hypothetical protein n=1 Tax=Streptomyces sp. AK010 TaxID=2723074 RepID=UPI0018203895|nr:hypothetical protein [Streptomyces sp. AK010]MBB6415807.1 hypothetical protein [Streptomyces sp. AK010]
MNTPESTAVPSAPDAEKHAVRTAVIARQLDQIAPGTARVQTVPVPTDRDGEQRLATWVVLGDALGGPVKADRDAHRAARGLLLRMFPAADWTRPQLYDAITGALAVDTPVMPEELRR